MILTYFINLKLSVQDTVSQTYDGAANFSGHSKVCATLFQKTVPHAQYVHCSNHVLNLGLCLTYHDIAESETCLAV